MSQKKKNPKPPSPSKLATVLPIELGEGLFAELGSRRKQQTAGVPGDKVSLAYDGTQLVTGSSDRIPAPCSLLGRCGGCSIQAMAYPAQLEMKRDALREVLGPLGAPDPLGQIRGLASPFGYRTKLLMPATMQGGRLVFGFYERGTTSLIEATGCPVQHPLTISVLAMAQQALQGAHVKASAARSKNGWLHGIGVRVDPGSGSAELVLAGRTHKLPGKGKVAEKLLAIPGVVGVHLSPSETRSSYLLGERFRCVAGRKRLAVHLLGREFQLSPGSFFQTSHEGATHLAETVLSMLPDRMETLADIYGGVGVFARLTSERWKRALVLESNPHAIADLRGWLKATGHRGIRVFEGRTEELINKVVDARPDVAILDPPRSGCNEAVIHALNPAEVGTLIYVACGTQSLVRDAAMLIEQGYRIDDVQPVDMFPHTTHLEVVVRLVGSEQRLEA